MVDQKPRRRSAPAHWNPACRRKTLQEKQTHSSWRKLIDRCNEQKIPLHPMWRAHFATFLSQVGPRPSEFHTLHRVVRDGRGFVPGNVKWMTKEEHRLNRTQADPKEQFMRAGRFDWDAWREAGSPE